jgi:aldehyde dehydrogenase (NAD+)
VSATETERPSIDTSPRRLLIGGDHVDAADGATFETYNPATGEAITTVARGDVEDVDRAVRAARAALSGPWGRVTPDGRQRLITRLAELVAEHGEELALLDVFDAGRTVSAARYLINDATELLRWYAAASRTIRGQTIENSRFGSPLSYTLREPIGVVGSITPWNAPLTMALWKLGPVLATGCTVVHKPAEQSPLSALRLAELCLEAGIPEGVVNVVTGDGAAGAALAAHTDVDKISFTGSIETGRRIIEASASNVKRLTMELGGKSPNIVFADADLEKAAPAAAKAIFLGSGQVCAAGSRLFVERPVYEEFVARVAEAGRAMTIGDPLETSTQLGPLISAAQQERVLGYIEAGLDAGARVLTGGGRPADEALSAGYYVEPTIFEGVDDTMSIVREEIFGPVLTAIPFDDVDEVVRRANAVPYGLAAAVWTKDIGRVQAMTRGLQAGNVWVNTYGALDPSVPMGGYGMSGYGKDLGDEQLDAFLSTKAVWIAG